MTCVGSSAYGLAGTKIEWPLRSVVVLCFYSDSTSTLPSFTVTRVPAHESSVSHVVPLTTAEAKCPVVRNLPLPAAQSRLPGPFGFARAARAAFAAGPSDRQPPRI